VQGFVELQLQVSTTTGLPSSPYSPCAASLILAAAIDYRGSAAAAGSNDSQGSPPPTDTQLPDAPGLTENPAKKQKGPKRQSARRKKVVKLGEELKEVEIRLRNLTRELKDSKFENQVLLEKNHQLLVTVKEVLEDEAKKIDYRIQEVKFLDRFTKGYILYHVNKAREEIALPPITKVPKDLIPFNPPVSSTELQLTFSTGIPPVPSIELPPVSSPELPPHTVDESDYGSDCGSREMLLESEVCRGRGTRRPATSSQASILTDH
jgi:hypothetical protein